MIRVLHEIKMLDGRGFAQCAATAPSGGRPVPMAAEPRWQLVAGSQGESRESKVGTFSFFFV